MKKEERSPAMPRKRPADAPERSRIAVLPLGAHEQHGPHLPFETDTIIAAGIAARAQALLPAHLDVVFLAAEPVGYSIEHMDVEGTRTIGYDEAIRRWLEIAQDLTTQGIFRLVLLNAHGGNSPLTTIVATEARVRFGMLCVATSWTRFGAEEGVVSPDEKAIGIHGGDIETSVMLALAPERVDMSRAKDFPSRQSDFIGEFHYLRAYGPHAFGWRMRDLNEQGVAGNAALATAEKGRIMIERAAQGMVGLLEDVSRFDLAIFEATSAP
jgi:creatinine amidohydrolase